jgi:hypothetical protein
VASPNYVALHKADSKAIMEHLDRIRATAEEIVNAVEDELAITEID